MYSSDSSVSSTVFSSTTSSPSSDSVPGLVKSLVVTSPVGSGVCPDPITPVPSFIESATIFKLSNSFIISSAPSAAPTVPVLGFSSCTISVVGFSAGNSLVSPFTPLSTTGGFNSCNLSPSTVVK